ncbi:uncharacterized protein LOC135389576 [Ornithodoros turicata]|uniref:uncharacterized protein LOC135389576 n=1 Tax=Ornithodoros turicata TaxID=34597 RepID=UPI00313906B7
MDLYQLACNLSLVSLVLLNAGIVSVVNIGPSQLALLDESVIEHAALYTLCHLGLAIASVESDIALIKLVLRRKFVPPGVLLGSQLLLPWHLKLKLLCCYKSTLVGQVRNLRTLSSKIWTLLYGDRYASETYFLKWSQLQSAEFARQWCSKKKTFVVAAPPTCKAGSASSELVNPFDVSISQNSLEVLSQPPKCSLPVKPTKFDVAALISHVSTKITDSTDRLVFTERCLSRIPASAYTNGPSPHLKQIRNVKDELFSIDAILLQCDKSGKFAVLPSAIYLNKVNSAIGDLFTPFRGSLQKYKSSIVSIFAKANHQMSKLVVKCKCSELSVKFLLKDHKPQMPLRVVVSETGTWQKLVAKFLQRGLKVLQLPGSLSLRNSEELIESLEPFHGALVTMFSLDIKDLYYSLNVKVLLRTVKHFIEDQLVVFQSEVGLSCDDFLSILECYLKSTVISVDNCLFVQKNDVCIGSAVAPVLSEIYLNTLDIELSKLTSYGSQKCVLIRRFVDDIICYL